MRRSFQGFERITVDPAMLGGKPCIRGMHLSMQRVLEILAGNPSWDDLRQDYPEFEEEDIPADARLRSRASHLPAPDASSKISEPRLALRVVEESKFVA